MITPSQSSPVLAALSYDPLAEAEQITGQSYKTCKATEALGFLGHLDHTQRTRELLKQARDTHYGMTAPWLISQLMLRGFDLLLTVPFKDVPHRSESKSREPFDERAHLLFNRATGVLVWLETFGRGSDWNREGGTEGSVNKVEFYFNWRPKVEDTYLERYSGHCVPDPSPLYKPTPTKGYPEDRAWAYVAYIDGRKGMFSYLDWLEEHGQFITPWLEQPFLWLLTYMDTKDPVTGESIRDYDYEAINAARLAQLPPDVVGALGPECA